MSMDKPLYMRRIREGELRRAGTPCWDIPRYSEPSDSAEFIGIYRFLALYIFV